MQPAPSYSKREGASFFYAEQKKAHTCAYSCLLYTSVWTSPRNAALICEKIAAALAEADPEGAEYYEAALGDYTASLDELDAAFKEVVANGARDTIVFADRFPLLYFARAYGLEYYAAWPGCADEAEPSAATVTFLIDKVKEEGIDVYKRQAIYPNTPDLLF